MWQDNQQNKSNSSSVRCLLNNQKFDSKQEYENHLNKIILKEKRNIKNLK